jgi:hypothetical protein
MLHSTAPRLNAAPAGSDYRTWNWHQIDELFVHPHLDADQWWTAPNRVTVYVVQDPGTRFRAGLQVFESKQGGPFYCLLTRHLPHSLHVSHDHEVPHKYEECFDWIESRMDAMDPLYAKPALVTSDDASILNMGTEQEKPARVAAILNRPRDDTRVPDDFMIQMETPQVNGSLRFRNKSRPWPDREIELCNFAVVAHRHPPLTAARAEALRSAIEIALQQLAAYLKRRYDWDGTFKVRDEYFNGAVDAWLHINWVQMGDGFYHHTNLPHHHGIVAGVAGQMA